MQCCNSNQGNFLKIAKLNTQQRKKNSSFTVAKMSPNKIQKNRRSAKLNSRKNFFSYRHNKSSEQALNTKTHIYDVQATYHVILRTYLLFEHLLSNIFLYFGSNFMVFVCSSFSFFPNIQKRLSFTHQSDKNDASKVIDCYYLHFAHPRHPQHWCGLF